MRDPRAAERAHTCFERLIHSLAAGSSAPATQLAPIVTS